MTTTTEFETFFIGGWPCIDFCNTFDHWHTPPQHDFLPDQTAVLRWAVAAGLLTTADADAALPDDTQVAHLKEVRALIFRVLLPITQGNSPSPADLAALNAALAATAANRQLVLQEGKFTVRCTAVSPLAQLECAVLRSTADLLLEMNPVRLKQCGGCGWLFYDTSRTGARRWCTMQLCGNRAKARRHYQKTREQTG